MIVGSGFGSISFNPMLSFPRGGGGGTPLRRPPPERPIDEEFDRQEAPGTPNWGSDSARGQAAGEGGQAWDESPTQVGPRGTAAPNPHLAYMPPWDPPCVKPHCRSCSPDAGVMFRLTFPNQT